MNGKHMRMDDWIAHQISQAALGHGRLDSNVVAGLSARFERAKVEYDIGEGLTDKSIDERLCIARELMTSEEWQEFRDKRLWPCSEAA